MNILAGNLGITAAAGYILAGILILLILGLVLLIIRRNIFRKRLKKSLESPEAMDAFKRQYSPEKLLKISRRMEKYAGVWGQTVIQETGLAPLWTERLEKKLREKDMRRVLLYCPEKDKFKALVAGQRNHRIQPRFLDWVSEEGGDRTLRILAASCRGEDFDGLQALSIIGEHLSSLREMTGDPEWHSRYFAYQILLHDEDGKSVRAVWDGFHDSHPLIRKTLAERFHSEEKDRLYNLLWNLILDDPVHEVRQSARQRILDDFMDMYNPDMTKLTSESALRVLQLLEDTSAEDRNIALEYLKSDNLELRYPAAIFLERCGLLDRMFLESSLDDREALERNFFLLQKAQEVNVVSFLSRIKEKSNSASLLIASRLLMGKGKRENLAPLAQEVFRFFSDKDLTDNLKEIYISTLESISLRGGDSSLNLYKNELEERKNSRSYLEQLLPRIPERADTIFLPLLVQFLKDDGFPARDLLLPALGKLPPELLLPSVFEILDGSRLRFSHQVRISSLRLLGLFKLPYCLQRILENLPILPQEEARDFARLLNEYPGPLFEKKVAKLLQTPDGQIRAALLSVLPATENRSFMKEIRDSLKDADPEVRISAVWSLLEFGEIKLLNQETSMLRDPVERVRLATARVIGRHGNPAALQVLEEILRDDNEVEPVKRAAIAGLGASESPQSMVILVDLMDTHEDFLKDIVAALSEKTSAKALTQLIDIFKDASPSLREKIVLVFQNQEEKAEAAILELLKTDVASLKPYIAEILEGTGYIEQTIRKLSHRNAVIRREAALWLSLLDTKSAFRGLVMAARDPDQEVRVLVVKALEKLNTPEGKAILEDLKQDPDRRIRKYTLWAMDRLTSLSLE